MSKIMRQIYAEARAAREAAAKPRERRVNGTPITVPNPVELARSTIEWWTTQIARVGERSKAVTSSTRHFDAPIAGNGC